MTITRIDVATLNYDGIVITYTVIDGVTTFYVNCDNHYFVLMNTETIENLLNYLEYEN